MRPDINLQRREWPLDLDPARAWDTNRGSIRSSRNRLLLVYTVKTWLCENRYRRILRMILSADKIPFEKDSVSQVTIIDMI